MREPKQFIGAVIDISRPLHIARYVYRYFVATGVHLKPYLRLLTKLLVVTTPGRSGAAGYPSRAHSTIQLL